MTRHSNLFSENTHPDSITLSSERGLYDPALGADCRGTYGCGGFVRPWVALSSLENWGEDVLTPEGLPDGDQPVYKRKFRRVENVEGMEIPVASSEEDDEPCYCKFCVQRLEDEELQPIEPELFVQIPVVIEEVETVDFFEKTFMPDDDFSIDVEVALPKRISQGIVSNEIDSRKEVRQGGRKHGRGTYQCGKRGNNRYKMLRRGRVRVTTRKSERIERVIHNAFTYYVSTRQRVVCHSGRML